MGEILTGKGLANHNSPIQVKLTQNSRNIWIYVMPVHAGNVVQISGHLTEELVEEEG
jgi:hypothetical protein